jgi:transposase
MRPMKPVATQLPEDPPALREMVVSLRAEMANKDQTIRLQQEMIRWLRIDKYGPQSERLNDRQFELLDGEPGVQAGEIDTETAHADDEQSVAPRPKKKPRNPSPGRHPLPAHLPRVEQVIHCSSEQCHCGHCGLV